MRKFDIYAGHLRLLLVASETTFASKKIDFFVKNCQYKYDSWKFQGTNSHGSHEEIKFPNLPPSLPK